jgi:hypothetical protein
VREARFQGTSSRFLVEGLEAGEYRLRLRWGPKAWVGEPVVVRAPARGVRLAYLAGVELVGQVEGALDETVWIRWSSGQEQGAAEVSSDGAFRIPGLRDGPTSLFLSVDDRYGLLEEAIPSKGPHRLRLVPGGRLAGRVDLPAGGAARPVLVRVVGGPVDRIEVPDAKGAFLVRGLPPGSYRIDLREYEQDDLPPGREWTALPAVEAGLDDVVVPYAPPRR